MYRGAACGGGGTGTFIKKVLLLWVFIGGPPFLIHFGSLVDQMAPILVGFGGVVASWVALGAQFAPGSPGAFHPLFFVSLAPKGNPRGSQNGAKVEKQIPKIDANIDAIFDNLLERFWLTSGVFVCDPGPSKMSVEVLIFKNSFFLCVG